MSARGGIVMGRSLGSGFDESCDVVIVGTGSGGAVMGALCAEAGLDVVMLEEGGHWSPEEYGKFRPSESLRRIAREAGLFVAAGLGDTPLISLLMGRAVGGSSLMTGGVCFRIPDDVLAHWSRDLGLPELSPDAMAPHFEAVEGRVHVEEVPVEVRSRSTELFLDGADKLGIPMYPLRRNTHGCQGKARCTFGCPHGAKMSVDHAWLPAVVAGGGRIYADCHVERVGLESGRARSVHGYVSTGPDGLEKRPFAVRAKVVVVACGTVHTPMLLSASGLEGQSRQLGRHITLHPAVRVSALFDEEVRGWDGALQSVYTDHFMDDGITLVGVYSAVNVLAAAFPGVGKEHLDHVRKMRGAAIFGGMIHDEGGGSVHRQPGREPLLTYRMVPEDKRRMLRTIGILAEMAFAGGAREVMLPVFGAPAMKSFAEVRALIDRNPEGRRIESTAFHPLGSARMAVNEKLGVVRHTGESWDVPGLYVCDGSVLPTSIGVNSQVPVMAVARKITTGLLDDWSRHARA